MSFDYRAYHTTEQLREQSKKEQKIHDATVKHLNEMWPHSFCDLGHPKNKGQPRICSGNHQEMEPYTGHIIHPTYDNRYLLADRYHVKNSTNSRIPDEIKDRYFEMCKQEKFEGYSKFDNLIKAYPGLLRCVDEKQRNGLHLTATYGMSSHNSSSGSSFLVEKYGFDIFEECSGQSNANAFLLSAKSGSVEQMKYFIGRNPTILNSVDGDGRNGLYLSEKSWKLISQKYRGSPDRQLKLKVNRFYEGTKFLEEKLKIQEKNQKLREIAKNCEKTKKKEVIAARSTQSTESSHLSWINNNNCTSTVAESMLTDQIAAYNARKSEKGVIGAKFMLTLEIRLCDFCFLKTDLQDLVVKIKTEIVMNGLVWGNVLKIGEFKFTIIATIEVEKVSSDDLTKIIRSYKEVKYVDIDAFKKL